VNSRLCPGREAERDGQTEQADASQRQQRAADEYLDEQDQHHAAQAAGHQQEADRRWR
jgi:hypothetical protein